jgi:DNA-binding response OmpR family regulator
MAERSALSGRTILVVEDNYMLAQDNSEALTRAGAKVLGPFSSEEEAALCAQQEATDCAVLDINLGEGPSFMLADELRDHGVPFLFVTGYDAEAIPPKYSDVPRLEKPFAENRMIEAVRRLCTGLSSTPAGTKPVPGIFESKAAS